MSMLISFAAVPKALRIPSRGETSNYLCDEDAEGFTDTKPEVNELGIFEDGAWNPNGLLELHLYQYLSCGLSGTLPAEGYYYVVTPELIASAESFLPVALESDEERIAGLERHEAMLPTMAPFFALAKQTTVEHVLTGFVVSARRALEEFGADYDIAVTTG